MVALKPSPSPVVTRILPVDAPLGTTTVRVVGLVTFTVEAMVLLNFTIVDPVKFVPVMLTVVPAYPLVGENETTVGGMITLNVTEDAVIAPTFTLI